MTFGLNIYCTLFEYHFILIIMIKTRMRIHPFYSEVSEESAFNELKQVFI